MPPKGMMGGKGEDYGSADKGLSAPTQKLMSSIGGELMMEKKLALIEMMGLEGKNQYEWRIDSKGKRGKGQMVAFTKEESSCINRILCLNGREATFTTTLGDKSGPVALKIKKDQYLYCFPCCSRPHSKVVDGNGSVLGEIQDPFHCCSMENIVVDGTTGKTIYDVTGSCITVGMCCPCLADQDFDIKDAAGKTVGSMRRVQLSMMECVCPAMNHWTISFPPEASDMDKALLCATQHMLDVNYFDPMRNNNNGGN